MEGHEKFTHLRDVYFHVNPDYQGRFTVPVLFDKVQQTIVNNESSEILRMLGTEVSLRLPLCGGTTTAIYSRARVLLGLERRMTPCFLH